MGVSLGCGTHSRADTRDDHSYWEVGLDPGLRCIAGRVVHKIYILLCSQLIHTCIYIVFELFIAVNMYNHLFYIEKYFSVILIRVFCLLTFAQ